MMNTYSAHIAGFIITPAFVRSIMPDSNLPSKLSSSVTITGRRNSDYDEEYLTKHKEKVYFSR